MRPYPSFVRLTLVASVLLIGVNLLALGVRYPLYAAIPAGCLAARNLGRWRVSTAHGSARAAGLSDLLARGMVGTRRGLILGTTAFMEPPGGCEALAALFNPALPSALAVRLFLAASCGPRWLGE